MIVSLVEEVLGTLQLHVKPYKNTTHIVRIIQKKKEKKDKRCKNKEQLYWYYIAITFLFRTSTHHIYKPTTICFFADFPNL